MMTEERINKIKRFGKRTFVGLLAFVLATEQVPWGNVWPLITAKADTVDKDYVPALYGTFEMDKNQDVEFDDKAITLSKKTQATGKLTITYDSSAADYSIKSLGVHIDTPTIFYNPVDKTYEALIVSANTYEANGTTRHYSPQDYAEANHLEIAGGVEVAFPGLRSDIWKVYNTSKTQSGDSGLSIETAQEEDAKEEWTVSEASPEETAEGTKETDETKKAADAADQENPSEDQENKDQEETAKDEESETTDAKDTADTEKAEIPEKEEKIRGGVRKTLRQ